LALTLSGFFFSATAARTALAPGARSFLSFWVSFSVHGFDKGRNFSSLQNLDQPQLGTVPLYMPVDKPF
jgi:hypothetical protein